ncbi:MAG TPA: ABC transporter permease [Methylomirabilota bacterium]|jgi:ABC-type nitrate/sulfonate/bicarbonate transport system permease component|nr:ABC transporter permease [Methylomirabilota bacterium]
MRGRRAVRTLSVALFLLGWQAASMLNVRRQFLNPILFPSPLDMVRAAYQESAEGLLWRDIAASLARVFQGFAIGGLIAVPLGCATGYFRRLEDWVDPIVELFRPIPPLALLPLFIIWLGIGEVSKVLLIAFSTFFPIFLNTTEGVRSIDPLHVRAALSLGADRWQIFSNVIVRSALPNIIVGLRLGFALGFFVLVAAELIAADSGLGYRIQESRNFFLVDRMFVGAAVIGVLGFTFNVALRRLEDLLLRWRTTIVQAHG